MTRSIPALCAVLMIALPARAQDWTIDWSTIDGGGEIAAEGGDWSLSGTFGQWDATANGSASGGPWELTGGFWGLGTASDFLFKDSFES
ncbi:hypothetical protein HFP89_12765 [Wenzhouxiangella sp. XN79A]|uniref:hypothetical protein n=1 Tax=Wenzhouxiangella sp. XN79A TaxID=2724193 RepID=UPI00144A7942|nr:hypothetical protein [Wenzhouxiangella sp. XN79A]NKI36035.1 hypothetical protein [Wenzhouxiangella sp. XN79A]